MAVHKSPLPVSLEGVSGPLPVRLVEVVGNVPVTIQGAAAPVPVHIEGAAGPVPVRIEEVPLPVPTRLESVALDVPVTLQGVAAPVPVDLQPVEVPVPVRVEDVPDFTRILGRQVRDDEEVRVDLPPPAALANGSGFVGLAPDAAATTDPVWTVMRLYFDANGQPARMRLRKDIAWDDRGQGWT